MKFSSFDIELLKSYDPIVELDVAAFARLKTLGLAFDPKKIDHDKAVLLAQKEFKKTRKNDIANSYIIGLSRNLPYLRTAIAAYSILTNFPAHSYEGRDGMMNCTVCGGESGKNIRDLTFVNSCRWVGTLIGGGTEPVDLWFALEMHNESIQEKASPEDEDNFIDVLKLASGMQEKANPLALAKEIKKSIAQKISMEEARGIVDTLGYAGILQTDRHKGWLSEFHGYLPPRSSRSSDWSYPVDFWRGSDGVDKGNLLYWFSDFKKINQWASLLP